MLLHVHLIRSTRFATLFCIEVFFMRLRETSGQATAEAVFVIPLLLLLLVVLLQPAIILYDRMIMSNAAAEGCRLLATRTNVGMGYAAQERFEEAIKHKLASIPPIALFHVHDSHCSWQVKLEGDEEFLFTTVFISTDIKLLPGFNLVAKLAGKLNKDGTYTIAVEQGAPALPQNIDSDALFSYEWDG